MSCKSVKKFRRFKPFAVFCGLIEAQNMLHTISYAWKCKSHAEFGVSMNVLALSKEGENFESESRILEPQRRELNGDGSMEISCS